MQNWDDVMWKIFDFIHNTTVISIRDHSNSAGLGGCSVPMKHHTKRPKAISSRQKNTDYDLLYVTLFHSASMRYETGIGTIDSIITISSTNWSYYICLSISQYILYYRLLTIVAIQRFKSRGFIYFIHHIHTSKNRLNSLW